MKYTFLHISDLHYRQGWYEENDLVCNRFFDDLKSQITSLGKIYVVFSGDFVLAGADNGLYSAFHKNFSARLDDLGISREQRICVPGNHDVSREALKPSLAIQKGSLSEIKDEQAFNNNLPQLSKLIFSNNFENYKTYESQFAHYSACTPELGGTGWELPDGTGLYCLNTALCSFAGIEDSLTGPISDQKKLMVDTRSLHKWLSENKSTTRILVMHHPADWLTHWAESELTKIIHDSFKLVFSGHIHENSATFSSRGAGGSVHCVAPPLFTRKANLLGYSLVTLDTSEQSVEVNYRQWSQAERFVAGSSLAGNDTGKIQFQMAITSPAPVEIMAVASQVADTSTILQAEFDEAITCYSSKKQLWVERDLARQSETDLDSDNLVMESPRHFAKAPRSSVIRAPKQYGLTCLGRFIALEYYRHNQGRTVLIMLDAAKMPRHRQGVIEHIELRCKELKARTESIGCVLLDNWHSEKGAHRILRELKAIYSSIPIILLQSVDDCSQIANVIESEEEKGFEPIYLWALSRTRIRELVRSYLQGHASLEEEAVTKKVIDDIDALNIHRTPLNCLLLLKLTEQAFDDSPVNRTEMIGRVLYLLFFQFDKIPRYATRPDIKDCEYALGFFCEWLIRSERKAFSKNDFYKKVQEYCSLQILDLDIEVLFAFLVSENIFVRKGQDFEFRFLYWLHFFAAHRMHHSAVFNEFILAETRYSAFPEMVEFYAGIDRRRSDAVIRLTQDLQRMNAEFLKRTGIPDAFNPFRHALWSPSDADVEQLKQQVSESLTDSAVPLAIKDAIADENYDRAKPYNQELVKFIQQSSLIQMVQAMRGAARVLRNSDHVSPEAKTMLLDEVLSCWIRVCQILVILSPVLVDGREATFEGMGFCLDKTFDQHQTSEQKWKALMTQIVGNVVSWFQEDIFSKKMGALFTKYVQSHETSLGELLVVLVMIRQKPPRWEKEVERLIVRENKNSFYLNRIFSTLYHEFKYGFSSEKTRQDLKRLAAMAIAKHSVGAKHPNKKAIEKAQQILDESNEPATDEKAE